YCVPDGLNYIMLARNSPTPPRDCPSSLRPCLDGFPSCTASPTRRCLLRPASMPMHSSPSTDMPSSTSASPFSSRSLSSSRSTPDTLGSHYGSPHPPTRLLAWNGHLPCLETRRSLPWKRTRAISG
ncbi:MAG: hypothetical protein M1823_008253, partial [Watsoniomyces obsoletus]